MVDTALLNWTLDQFLSLVIIITRVGPLVFFMPVLGSRSVPGKVKALFTLLTSLLLIPAVDVNPSELPVTVLGFVLFTANEIVFGATLALFTRFVFAATEIAGQMVGVQMGMGMAAAMDPEFGTQIPLIGQLLNLVAILLFLSVNGHHIFFQTLVESFNWVQPGKLHLTDATYQGMMRGVVHMFVLSVKIMAPAGAVLIFSHVAMGIVAKTVPQIPILIVGMPLNISLGLIFVGLSFGFFLPIMVRNFDMLGRLLTRMTMGMG
ncbi:MAG: flagellar biosynthetic protein FliR [Thermodesulfobacteriota bacterium]|nr:flagellar biosynthetic protein FliR [Thermodesulfobacteriota bacterium]